MTYSYKYYKLHSCVTTHSISNKSPWLSISLTVANTKIFSIVTFKMAAFFHNCGCLQFLIKAAKNYDFILIKSKLLLVISYFLHFLFKRGCFFKLVSVNVSTCFSYGLVLPKLEKRYIVIGINLVLHHQNQINNFVYSWLVLI